MPVVDTLTSLLDSEEDRALASEIHDNLPAPIDHYAGKLLSALETYESNDQRSLIIRSLSELLEPLADKAWALMTLADYFELSPQLAELAKHLQLADESPTRQQHAIANLIIAITQYPHYLAHILENLDAFGAHKAEFIREICNLLNNMTTFGGSGFSCIPQISSSTNPERYRLLILHDDQVNMALTHLVAEGFLTAEQEVCILKIFYTASRVFYSSKAAPEFNTRLCDQEAVNTLLLMATKYPDLLASLAELLTKIQERKPDMEFSPVLIQLLLSSIQPRVSEQILSVKRVLQNEHVSSSDIYDFIGCLELIDDERSNLLLALCQFYFFGNQTAAIEGLLRHPDKKSTTSSFFRTAFLALKGDPESAYTLIKISRTKASPAEFFTKLYLRFNIYDALGIDTAAQCQLEQMKRLADGLLLDPTTAAMTKRRYFTEEGRLEGLFRLQRTRTPSSETEETILSEALVMVSPTAE